MNTTTEELQAIARDCRRDIVKMVHSAKSGHPGGSLSCIDILVTLYFGGVLKHDPNDAKSDECDRFILAKGHAAPALYAVLANAGYIDKASLPTLRKYKSILQGHPDRLKCPGVEVSTGSLGQGLSIACGEALGLELKGNDKNCVFALLGDGECQEGQVWEAFMFASQYGLDNLVAIIDRNNLQIDGNVNDVMSLGDLSAKASAFGWDVVGVDGHNIDELKEVLLDVKEKREGKPKCIIANTIKGKGVSFMENQAGWHGKAPNDEELEIALNELA